MSKKLPEIERTLVGLLWSSFFVTLMAKKISVFQIAVYYAAILAL